jgi:hypothetical protein
MNIRHVCRVITVGLFVGGVSAIGSVRGLAQQSPELPKHGGEIVMYGCFVHDTVGKHEEYLLANPTIGYAPAVPDQACAAKGLDDAIELQHFKKSGLDDSMLGKFVELRGRLESRENKRELREVHVRIARLVPIAPMRTAEAAPPVAYPANPPEITPAPEPAAPETPAPVATTGETPTLPKTASPLPLVGLLGFLSLAAGLAIRRARARRVM